MTNDTIVAALTLQGIIAQAQAALRMLESEPVESVREVPTRNTNTGRERTRANSPRRARAAAPAPTTAGVDQKFLSAVQKGATVAQFAKTFGITESAIRARLDSMKNHGWNVIHEGNTYRAESRATA